MVQEACPCPGSAKWLLRIVPAISKGYPHANACLTCTHFRTSEEYLPVHKEELERTEQIIEKAKINSWIRQVEMNEKVKEN